MATQLNRLTHKIVLQLHLVAESCTICTSRSRQPVRKPLDTPSYVDWNALAQEMLSARLLLVQELTPRLLRSTYLVVCLSSLMIGIQTEGLAQSCDRINIKGELAERWKRIE
jgi:hypothetical protein